MTVNSFSSRGAQGDQAVTSKANKKIVRSEKRRFSSKRTGSPSKRNPGKRAQKANESRPRGDKPILCWQRDQSCSYWTEIGGQPWRLFYRIFNRLLSGLPCLSDMHQTIILCARIGNPINQLLQLQKNSRKDNSRTEVLKSSTSW